MAGEEGLEPSNAGIKIRCLNQLGDSPTQLDVSCLQCEAILASNWHQTKFFTSAPNVTSGACLATLLSKISSNPVLDVEPFQRHFRLERHKKHKLLILSSVHYQKFLAILWLFQLQGRASMRLFADRFSSVFLQYWKSPLFWLVSCFVSTLLPKKLPQSELAPLVLSRQTRYLGFL